MSYHHETSGAGGLGETITALAFTGLSLFSPQEADAQQADSPIPSYEFGCDQNIEQAYDNERDTLRMARESLEASGEYDQDMLNEFYSKAMDNLETAYENAKDACTPSNDPIESFADSTETYTVADGAVEFTVSYKDGEAAAYQFNGPGMFKDIVMEKVAPAYDEIVEQLDERSEDRARTSFMASVLYSQAARETDNQAEREMLKEEAGDQMKVVERIIKENRRSSDL